MNDTVLYFLIFGGAILLFNLVFIIAMFRGDYFYQDEKELKERPYSRRSQAIEMQRYSGGYNTYVPKNERENYLRKYNNLQSNEDKKGGE